MTPIDLALPEDCVAHGFLWESDEPEELSEEVLLETLGK